MVNNIYLERICAEIGFGLVDKIVKEAQNKTNVAKELEKIVTKALGILIEDGLFAYAIWLESENKDPHKVIIESSLGLLKRLKLIKNYQNNLREAILNDISPYIEKTLLARQLLERMLVYARYRAKALQKGD